MAKINHMEIKRLAHLARIGLSDAESQVLQQDLAKILDYVEQLNQADLLDLDPTEQVTGLKDIWREDVALPSEFSRAELLKNAPMQQDGYIKVKRVL